MSRMRMTFFVVVFLALGAIVGALAASSTQPSLDVRYSTAPIEFGLPRKLSGSGDSYFWSTGL